MSVDVGAGPASDIALVSVGDVVGIAVLDDDGDESELFIAYTPMPPPISVSAPTPAIAAIKTFLFPPFRAGGGGG
ncbi:MAG: hypothetical protein U0165_18435 [Polyangiaceae bacterium]